MKRSWKGKLFDQLSMAAVLQGVKENRELHEAWKCSERLFADFFDHLPGVQYNLEEQTRVRMLVSGQGYFLNKVIGDIAAGRPSLSWLDVGDSDGSARMLVNELVHALRVESLGVNLQEQAVAHIRKRGLPAERIDAMELIRLGRAFDIVSLFETMEHLPDPIGFLQTVRPLVRDRLVLSVPLVPQSRVSLLYLSPEWPVDKKATIANTHIFELFPKDWTKLFLHTGWLVDREWSLYQYPRSGPLRIFMEAVWRMRGEGVGFWFVSLKKDETFSRKYHIE